MKVGILTFHYAHNYGAMLQAYALSTKLNLLGHEAYIIDYRLKYIYKFHEKLNFCGFFRRYRENNNYIISVLKTLKNYHKHRKRPIKWYRFELFLNSLQKTERLYTIDQINQQQFDAIICGSDQIWNSRLTGNLIPLYFAKDLYANRKIAYAASCGGDRIPEKDIEGFSKLYSNFTSVSIRETGFSNFLANMGLNNRQVLDPVFLLDAKQWESIAIAPSDDEYVLTYSFNESPNFFKKAIEVASILKKKLVVFAFEVKKDLPSDVIQYIEGGPCEFVGYIKNASFILTNSFHGTAFSILFRKSFYCIPPLSGRERTDTILNSLNLSNRIIEDSMPLPHPTECIFDEELIERAINNSLDFLEVSLS